MAGRSNQSAPNSIPRRRKRAQPLVYSSLPSSSKDKDNDYVCPICFEMIDEPYMTKCGHSFCHKCIVQSLSFNTRCPRCSFAIEKKEDVFPNLMLNELILKHKQRLTEQKRIKLNPDITRSEIDELICQEGLDMTRVNVLIDALAKQKHKMEGELQYAQYLTLKDFLQQVEATKRLQVEEAQKELDMVKMDLQRVCEKLEECTQANPYLDKNSIYNGRDVNMPVDSPGAQNGFNGSKNGTRPWLQTNLVTRRKKVTSHFDDLQTCYFSTKQNQSWLEDVDTGERLAEFTESLSKFTRFSEFRVLATLNYASDMYNNSSIVSSIVESLLYFNTPSITKQFRFILAILRVMNCFLSHHIEFDRDSDFFAIAGVTKKIKVFEYQSVIKEHVDLHYPVHEMVCNSKISSVIWSTYHKNILASSDYEGTVTMWDAFSGNKLTMFQEHEKRCWSVDFNHKDPNLLASGSDDSKVKLWNINMEHSVASIEAKANVCCVKFNPDSRFHLAFGSADHCVHYYDLRNAKQPLGVFKGHKKAVSYAKFLNTNQVVSASTDSQLKLWNLAKPHCLRTFRGHINEKNFVGLATDGDYVACGSENNSLYVYYHGLTKHVITHKFESVRNVLEKDKKEGDDQAEFVSAVCWRKGSDVVVAANSQGVIKVLELT